MGLSRNPLTAMTAAATDPLLSLSHYYLPVYKPRQVVLERGQGARVWDTQGVNSSTWPPASPCAGWATTTRT